jgi:hypothetical protein
VLDARVDRHDPIEHAGMSVGIQLDKDGFHANLMTRVMETLLTLPVARAALLRIVSARASS